MAYEWSSIECLLLISAIHHKNMKKCQIERVDNQVGGKNLAVRSSHGASAIKWGNYWKYSPALSSHKNVISHFFTFPRLPPKAVVLVWKDSVNLVKSKSEATLHNFTWYLKPNVCMCYCTLSWYLTQTKTPKSLSDPLPYSRLYLLLFDFMS